MVDKQRPLGLDQAVAFASGVPDATRQLTNEHSAPIDPPHLGEFGVGAFSFPPHNPFPR